jgi:TonB-linked SusC/RagA family outer membrane protein
MKRPCGEHRPGGTGSGFGFHLLRRRVRPQLFSSHTSILHVPQTAMKKHNVLAELAPPQGQRHGETGNRRREREYGSRGGPILRGIVAAALLLLGAGVLEADAQQPARTQISGVVTSAEDGRPLPSVSVVVAGTAIGTLTNQLGRYTLNVPAGSETLAFSLIGFGRVEVPIAGRSVVNASLQPQAVALQEIVATGYGQQRRRDVTGAISSVSGERLAEVATPNVVQALQGRAAGVQVTPASGQPGTGAVVRIRGVGTLNNASPLYVVDGMLLDDINWLSPNDITSVEVLKDASATAIYGSRGANGVIIVTTRRGSVDRPTTFSINAYTGTQNVQSPIPLLNAQEYATLANELAANLGQQPYFADPNAVGPGTDWQREIFQSAPIHSVQLAASGGTDRITYYFSGNFIQQAGSIPKSDFSRFTLRLNNDYQLSDRISLGQNLNFTYRENLNPPGVLRSLYYADPTITPRNEEGDFSDASARSSAGNPAAGVHYTNNQAGGNRLVGNLFADFDLPLNVTFRSSFGLDHGRSESRSFSPVFFVSAPQQNQVSSVNVNTSTASSWLWENTMNYSLARTNHRLTALAGITAQSFVGETLGGSRTNVVGEDRSLWYLSAAGAEGQTNFNSARDWRMLSYLFRTNYSLLDRYLLTASMRVDGSSRFGEANRYGYFPSFALGWNLHDEAFLRGIEPLTELKLRGSWGQIGNDRIGEYAAFATVSGNLNAVFGPDESLRFGASPITLANPEIRWERTTQANIGADLSLFGGEVRTTVDYYRRLTDGILVQLQIPRYVGSAGNPTVNAAEVENRGFEGSINWVRRLGEFGVELGANGATIRNEVKALGEGREFFFTGSVAGMGNTQRTVVGQPIASFWGFKTDGIFQTQEEINNAPRRPGNPERPGDLRYVDLNGDGVINDLDRTWIGKSIPDFVYGFTSRLDWRGLDVSAAFSGQSGNQILNGKKANRIQVENWERSYLDRWTGPGTSNTEPRLTQQGHNFLPSEYWMEDGSFLKLHTAQLGYRLPQGVTDRLQLGQTRLYVSGTNLFTLTGYSGYTPELMTENVLGAPGIDLGVYPPMRTITVGLDLSF